MSAVRKKNQRPRSQSGSAVELPELLSHLRENGSQLREEWARRITEGQRLTSMTQDEIFAEARSIDDNYVDILETGAVGALQAYARNLSERTIPRGVETHEVVGIVLLLRNVLARSLFKKYRSNFKLFNKILDAYEPVANRIAVAVAVGFVQERERIIHEQQDAIRELSTVEAARLLGATSIVTGLSPEIARTLVTIAVDLTKMNTVCDLRGGIEEADRALGFRVTRISDSSDQEKGR